MTNQRHWHKTCQNRNKALRTIWNEYLKKIYILRIIQEEYGRTLKQGM